MKPLLLQEVRVELQGDFYDDPDNEVSIEEFLREELRQYNVKLIGNVYMKTYPTILIEGRIKDILNWMKDGGYDDDECSNCYDIIFNGKTW